MKKRKGKSLRRKARREAADAAAESTPRTFHSPLLLVARGKNAVAVVRRMMGPTFGSDAPPGTIRGDFALSNRFNLVHGSDSEESAEHEISLFFGDEPLIETDQSDLSWVYDTSGGDLV